MKLSAILSQNTVIPALRSTSKEGVIEEMAEVISASHPPIDKGEIIAALSERENLGSTGTEDGIAIPHAKIKDLRQVVLAIGRSRKGIEFNAHDGKKSRIFFVLLAPDKSIGIHLKTLSRLSRLLKTREIRTHIMEAETAKEMFDLIIEEDGKLQC